MKKTATRLSGAAVRKYFSPERAKIYRRHNEMLINLDRSCQQTSSEMSPGIQHEAIGKLSGCQREFSGKLTGRQRETSGKPPGMQREIGGKSCP
jgi:hypothetical protein